jgi:hypothetical protein
LRGLRQVKGDTRSGKLGGAGLPDVIQGSQAMLVPSPWDAPRALLAAEGNCGLLSVWMVLKSYRRHTSSARILRACRHTKKYGTFTIALAVALREHGLEVRFHSEPDPSPRRIERAAYRVAAKAGVRLGPALRLQELLDRIGGHRTAIVYMEMPGGQGHFSPLLGVRDGLLVLPNTDEGMLPPDEFERRWTRPDILRQRILVVPAGGGA